MYVLRTLYMEIVLFFMAEFVGADWIYRKVGGSVVLDPGPIFDPITSVTWKHQSDLALEWFGDDITCFRDFKGRCELNKTTGSFIIKNLTPKDSGSYTPEINNKVLDQKILQLLEPVPKPTVSTECNNEKTFCNLTCNAQITSEFGTVTYKWESGGKVLSNNKELSLTMETQEESFICKLENPVSSESSEEVANPLSRGNHGVKIVVGVILSLILIGVGVGVGIFLIRKKGGVTWLRKKFESCWQRTQRYTQPEKKNSRAGGDDSVAEKGSLLEKNSGAETTNTLREEKLNGETFSLIQETNRKDEKQKDSTCEHLEVSVSVHPTPELSEASNQVPATKSPETRSQTGQNDSRDNDGSQEEQSAKDQETNNKKGSKEQAASTGPAVSQLPTPASPESAPVLPREEEDQKNSGDNDGSQEKRPAIDQATNDKTDTGVEQERESEDHQEQTKDSTSGSENKDGADQNDSRHNGTQEEQLAKDKETNKKTDTGAEQERKSEDQQEQTKDSTSGSENKDGADVGHKSSSESDEKLTQGTSSVNLTQKTDTGSDQNDSRYNHGSLEEQPAIHQETNQNMDQNDSRDNDRSPEEQPAKDQETKKKTGSNEQAASTGPAVSQPPTPASPESAHEEEDTGAEQERKSEDQQEQTTDSTSGSEKKDGAEQNDSKHNDGSQDEQPDKDQKTNNKNLL